jgi:hypothetical protein
MAWLVKTESFAGGSSRCERLCEAKSCSHVYQASE